MSQHDIYDITIIGGGPTGLFSAFYAGMRNAKTLIIESLPQLGGQLMMLYPEKYIYDVAGFPKIPARELIDNLLYQVKEFNHTIVTEETVLSLNHLDDKTIQVITNKETYLSKSVIIAAGGGAFKPRELAVDEASLCIDKSLHYFVTDLEKFRDRQVVIAGGGDTAIDWALMLEPIAKSVSLLHRRKEFRAHEHSLNLLKKSSVKIHTPYVIKKLSHKDGYLHHLTIENPKEQTSEIIEVDDLIVNYGFSSSLGEIKKWQLELQNKTIKVNSNMSTNLPGVFAAGDICTYPGKVALIATGFGEAPTAVNNALHYISPKTRIQPGHSTSMFDN